MDSNEFLEEALRNDNTPSEFETKYRFFQKYQKIALDTLSAFHEVCNKNGIHYQLAYGSLLGAIRDGGQIPWDYDIDVFVPYIEKPALIESLKRDLSNRFYFVCPENDKHNGTVLLRVVPKGYRSTLLHVDVFFLAGTPKDGVDEFRKSLRRKAYIYTIKSASIAKPWLLSKKHALRIAYEKIKLIGKSTNRAYREYDTLSKKYPISESDICINANQYCKAFESKLLSDLILYSTKVGDFFVPARYDEVLTYLFGDYMVYPDISKCIHEVLYYEKALTKYAQI